MTELNVRGAEARTVAHRRSAIGSVAGWSGRHPVIAIAGWVALVVMCVLGGNLAGSHKASDDQLTAGEAGRAASMITAAGLDGKDVESVLLTGRNGPIPDTAARAAASAVNAGVTGLPSVSGVAPLIRAADGSAWLLPVSMVGNADDPGPLLRAVSRAAAGFPDVQVGVSGSLTIGADIDAQLGRDFSSALVISLPITIVILLLAFGALLAAGVPLLLGISAVLAAVGLSTVASHVLPDGGSTAELILLIGMAVGVDYSLFYLKREREERRLGCSTGEALTRATATAGHAVVTSGCAVTVAMAGLFLVGDVNFASMAVGAIFVVSLAVLGSLTVLPAVLGVLGARVDRPRIPLLSRLTMSNRPARVWPALLRPALKHPAVTLAAGVFGMLLLAWPATTLHLKNSTAADLPQSLPSVAAYGKLTAAFPGQQSSMRVVVHGRPDAVAEAVRRVGVGLAGTSPLRSVPEVSASGDTAVVTVAVPFAADSRQARAALTAMRQTELPQATAGLPGMTTAVGGSIAENVDYLDELASGAPLVVAFVLLMTFVLMMWSFRSVVVGLVTIAANALSAGAAFGVLALVFQSAWGAELLGFHPSHAVIAWIPVFLFVILFGLSMDYHVLVVARIREGVDRGLPTKDAVREGVTASASVITSAAAVMIGVFAIFAGLHMIEFKELGVGLAAAIFLDAVVVRILILPSLMVLLGRANWWAPAFLRRRPVDRPSVHVETSVAPAGSIGSYRAQ